MAKSTKHEHAQNIHENPKIFEKDQTRSSRKMRKITEITENTENTHARPLSTKIIYGHGFPADYRHHRELQQ